MQTNEIVNNNALTSNQQTFLIHRFQMATDKAAAELMGITDRTVRKWKIDSPEFVSAYEKWLESKATIAALPKDFDEELWFEKQVPMAYKRMGEILGIEVNADTKAQIIAQVRQAAEKILVGTGRLQGGDIGILSITQIVNNFLAEGEPGEREYSPGFVHIVD